MDNENTESEVTRADRLWTAQADFSHFEDELDQLVAPAEFERLTHDYYDMSLEMKEVSDDLRMSANALKHVWQFGFAKLYVNHLDGWETHYSKNGDPLGWRRRYVKDASAKTTNVLAGPDNPGYYEISRWPEGWGTEEEDRHGWLASGYMRIVGDPLNPTPRTR